MTLTAAIYLNTDPGGLLYWDSASGTMKVGSYTAANGLRSDTGASVSLANVIFAKFGSTVGFTLTGTSDGWTADDVKFNPTGSTYAGTAAGYANIPCWNGTVYSEGYISTTNYHTLANVKAGRGDICKLAGKTATQAKNGDIDNGEWRLPTNYENQLFVGNPTKYTFNDKVTPNIMTFENGHSLPALGYRDGNVPSGASCEWGTCGQYYSSTASDQGGGGWGIDFSVVIGGIRPSDADTAHHAPTIRCVRQTP